MKIAVGGVVYDGNEVPIAVILGPEDRANIARMAPDETIYCNFPNGTDAAEVVRWVDALKPSGGPARLETNLDSDGREQAEMHAVDFEEHARRTSLWLRNGQVSS